MSREARFPDRPGIPVSLYSLLVVMAVERLVLLGGMVPPPLATAPLFLLLLALSCVLVRRVGSEVVALTVFVAASATIALFASSARSSSLERAACVLARTPPSACTYRVSSDSAASTGGYRSRAVACVDGEAVADVWLSSKDELRAGDVVRCVGRFRSNSDDEWGRSNRGRGIMGSVSAVRVVSRGSDDGALAPLRAFREDVISDIVSQGSDGSTVLAGCLCGYRGALKEREVDRLFSTCGVSHLIAVSGTHIAIVAELVAMVMSRIGARRLVSAVVLLLSIGSFVLFCGAPPSAVRAGLMSVVASGAALAGRRGQSLSAVCAVAIPLCLVEPCLSCEVGFLLSVVAVASLCLFAPYAAYVIEVLFSSEAASRWASRRRWGRRALETLSGARRALAVTLVAQVATAPIMVSNFSEISLVAPFTNLLVSPFVAIVVALGVASCLLRPAPWASLALVRTASVIGDAVVAVLRTVSACPFSSVSVSASEGVAFAVFFGLSLALLIWWPRVNARLVRHVMLAVFVGSACLLFRWRFFAPARVCVLDVGQGDAILVQDGSSAILVDVGPDDSVVQELQSLHVLHLDAVVVTHLHGDHYGGFDSLSRGIGCDRVLVARGVSSGFARIESGALARTAPEGVGELGLGDALDCGGFHLRVVWPESDVDGTQNAHSLELVLSYDEGGRSMTGLLTGDAERDETGEVVDSGRVGRIDFLKVGHHGSRVCLTPSETKALSPLLSVASAGEGNSYGHPSEEAVDMLEDVGSRFFCTKDVGRVVVAPGSGGLEVSCERVPEPLPDVA